MYRFILSITTQADGLCLFAEDEAAEVVAAALGGEFAGVGRFVASQRAGKRYRFRDPTSREARNVGHPSRFLPTLRKPRRVGQPRFILPVLSQEVGQTILSCPVHCTGDGGRRRIPHRLQPGSG
jgi:hypothetical protein